MIRTMTQTALPQRLVALAALTILTMLLAVSSARPAGWSSARSVGMAEAYIGLAKGVDAARYNPANLGLTDYQITGLELVGLGADISNNAFTLNDYNKYNGAFLTTSDKEDILDKIHRSVPPF